MPDLVKINQRQNKPRLRGKKLVGVWVAGALLMAVFPAGPLISEAGVLVYCVIALFWGALAVEHAHWTRQRLESHDINLQTTAAVQMIPWMGALLAGAVGAIASPQSPLMMGIMVGWMTWPAVAVVVWAGKKILKPYIDAVLYERQQRKLNPAQYAPLVEQRAASRRLTWAVSAALATVAAASGVSFGAPVLVDDPVWQGIFAWPAAWLGVWASVEGLKAWLRPKALSAALWDARAALQRDLLRGWSILAALGLILWAMGALFVASWPISATLWALQGSALGAALVLGTRWVEPRRLQWERTRLLTCEASLSEPSPVALIGRDAIPSTSPPSRVLETAQSLPIMGCIIAPMKHRDATQNTARFLTGDQAFDAEVYISPSDDDPAKTSRRLLGLLYEDPAKTVRQLLVVLNQAVRHHLSDAVRQGVELLPTGQLIRRYYTYEHSHLTDIAKPLQSIALLLTNACPSDWLGDEARERLFASFQADPSTHFRALCAAALWQDHVLSPHAQAATKALLAHDPLSQTLHQAALQQDTALALTTLRNTTPWPDVLGVEWLWAQCLLSLPQDAMKTFFKDGVGRLLLPSHTVAHVLIEHIVQHRPPSAEPWLCHQLSHPDMDLQLAAVEALQEIGTLDAARALRARFDPAVSSNTKVRLVSTFHIRQAAKHALHHIQTRLGAHAGELALTDVDLTGALSEPDTH